MELKEGSQVEIIKDNGEPTGRIDKIKAKGQYMSVLEKNGICMNLNLKLITPKPFTKDDLKDGMIATLRSGDLVAVLKDKLVFYENGSGGNWLISYNKELQYKGKNGTIPEFDIMKVKRGDVMLFERGNEKSYYMEYIFGNNQSGKGRRMTKEFAKETIDDLFENDLKYLKIEVNSCNTN